MSPRRVPNVRALVALGIIGLLACAGLIRLDRGSPERGNRLLRAGQPEAAARIYASARAGGESTTQMLSYNLGTALLGTGADSATAPLVLGVSGPDSIVSHRALYNLGYRYLTAVDGSAPPDSVVPYLSEAVRMLRASLRLDPSDEDARWNLALAQSRLDALAPVSGTPDMEGDASSEDELVIDDLAMSRSETADAVSGLEPEDPRSAENRGERQGAEEGAQEAWAAQDPGPMDAAAARTMLERVADDPEALVRGILWSHRPDIAWWESQPYPGGSW